MIHVYSSSFTRTRLRGAIERLHPQVIDLVSRFFDEMLAVGSGVDLVAGFGTTSNMIGLGTVALLEKPDQFGALRDHLSLAVSGAEVLLRYLTVPPGSEGAGLPQKGMEGAGQVIRPGDGISQMHRRLRGVLASATSR